MPWIATVVSVSLLAAGNVLNAAAPEIYSLNPSEGPAGTEITVKGTGFSRTRHVLFCAGLTGRDARFKVVSDSELKVTAPVFPQAGTNATPVIITSLGATVGVPASVLEIDSRRHDTGADTPFCHVLRGGEIHSPHGIVFVEDGGVATVPINVAVSFVRNGGTLRDADRLTGLVVHEPHAILQLSPKAGRQSPARLFQVRNISASRGVEPFVYQRPVSSDAPAESPPLVNGIAPHRVIPSKIDFTVP